MTDTRCANRLCRHERQVHTAADGSLCRGLCGDRHDPASHTGACSARCQCLRFIEAQR